MKTKLALICSVIVFTIVSCGKDPVDPVGKDYAADWVGVYTKVGSGSSFNTVTIAKVDSNTVSMVLENGGTTVTTLNDATVSENGSAKNVVVNESAMIGANTYSITSNTGSLSGKRLTLTLHATNQANSSDQINYTFIGDRP